MATVTANLPVNSGSYLRTLGRQLLELSYDVPDGTTGGTNVLTVSNAPTSPGQVLEFSITAGPASGKKRGN